MINRELTDGQHIRPLKYHGLIPRSFFHLPAELKEEIQDAGLNCEKILAIEGPIWFTPRFEEKWKNDASRKSLLDITRKVEEQESLQGMSPHLLGIVRKG